MTDHPPYPSGLDGPHSPLAAILRDEIRECRELLRWTRLARTALSENDATGLSAAVAQRREILDQLQTLERSASSERGENFTPSTRLAPDVERLAELLDEIAREEGAAAEDAANTLTASRQQLRSLTQGSRVLQGYQGPRRVEPRFTDRKG
jgi:hypothetical protein